MKKYSFNDDHTAEAAIFCCLDPRFAFLTKIFIRKELRIKIYDLYSFSGGPLNLVRLETSDIFWNSLLKVSVDLHKIKKIILIQHQDCGAYRLFRGLSGEEAAKEQKTDIIKIKNQCRIEIPHVIVESYFMRIISSNDVTFEPI